MMVILRSAIHRMTKSMRDVVRDPNQRIVPNGTVSNELRELTEWINFLADDTDKSHHALAREKMLLATVTDDLTQSVIAVDSEHRIELLNDATRKILRVT